MKKLALSAALTLFSASVLIASPQTTQTSRAAQDCPRAPAVAAAYLRAQAGRKLTMTRGAVIAEITKNTGDDGTFAALKPCDSGYANAVRFYIDEVIKAGTNNSTPQTAQ
jgi:hypothetical protein